MYYAVVIRAKFGWTSSENACEFLLNSLNYSSHTGIICFDRSLEIHTEIKDVLHFLISYALMNFESDLNLANITWEKFMFHNHYLHMILCYTKSWLCVRHRRITSSLHYFSNHCKLLEWRNFQEIFTDRYLILYNCKIVYRNDIFIEENISRKTLFLLLTRSFTYPFKNRPFLTSSFHADGAINKSRMIESNSNTVLVLTGTECRKDVDQNIGR